jgi:hypothetical protein
LASSCRVQVLPEEPESLPTQSKVLKNERGEGEDEPSDDDDDEDEVEEEDDVQVRPKLTSSGQSRRRPAICEALAHLRLLPLVPLSGVQAARSDPCRICET